MLYAFCMGAVRVITRLENNTDTSPFPVVCSIINLGGRHLGAITIQIEECRAGTTVVVVREA